MVRDPSEVFSDDRVSRIGSHAKRQTMKMLMEGQSSLMIAGLDLREASSSSDGAVRFSG
jgi:uncharacterized membrane protein